MEKNIQEVMKLFDEEVKNFHWDFGRLGYVPSQMPQPNIDDVIVLTGKQKPLFLEIGCGFGRNILLAGMLGFEAYGIDIRLNSVEHGNKYIRNLKSKGIVDDSVSAELYYGNILPKDFIEEFKKLWITYISKKLGLEKSEVESRIEEQMASSLDFLTDDEFKQIFKHKPRNGMRIQRFELYDEHGPIIKNIVSKKLLQVTPPFILENPYKDKGLDVYDVMGKKFGDFDYFYSWSFLGITCNLIAEIIRRHHSTPYIWVEYRRERNASNFLPVKEYIKLY